MLRILIALSLASCGVEDSLPTSIALCNGLDTPTSRAACVCRRVEPGHCYALTLDDVTLCLDDGATDFPAGVTFCPPERLCQSLACDP